MSVGQPVEGGMPCYNILMNYALVLSVTRGPAVTVRGYNITKPVLHTLHWTKHTYSQTLKVVFLSTNVIIWFVCDAFCSLVSLKHTWLCRNSVWASVQSEKLCYRKRYVTHIQWQCSVACDVYFVRTELALHFTRSVITTPLMLLKIPDSWFLSLPLETNLKRKIPRNL